MADSTHTTEWRPVVGFPGYEVSNMGEVKSLARTVYRGDTSVRLNEKRIAGVLKRNTTGRPIARVVTLRRDGKTYHVRIHRLVLEAFVGPCPPSMEGCHNDGNPDNNWLGNLRWDTHEANREDAVRHGTLRKPPLHIGEAHPRAKMTAEKARIIKAVKHWPYGSIRRLAQELGVTVPMINGIRRGDTWRDIT